MDSWGRPDNPSAPRDTGAGVGALPAADGVCPHEPGALTVPGGGASFRTPSGYAIIMSIIDSRHARKGVGALILTLGMLLSGACAGVPYQEMSDARQAVDSADAVVEPGDDADALLGRARELLSTAEDQLHAGDYGAARATAERAKGLAIEAREQAGTTR